MNPRSFFDRMSSKTVSSLACAHLQEHYRLSPAAAQALSRDLLRFAQLMSQRAREDGQVIYHAVALDEPPGKPLSTCRKVAVRLTLFAEGDFDVLRKGRVALARHVMQRIAREATDQGAPLTIEDMAWLLRVSPTTIKRLRRSLAREDVALTLRGDLTDAGPARTHREPIVKLFLLGYSETEIAARCNHDLACVEAYIYDFLRVALLAKEGKAPGTICRLVKLSRTKVNAIVELYDRLRGHPDYCEPVDHWLDIFALERTMKKRGART